MGNITDGYLYCLGPRLDNEIIHKDLLNIDPWIDTKNGITIDLVFSAELAKNSDDCPVYSFNFHSFLKNVAKQTSAQHLAMIIAAFEHETQYLKDQYTKYMNVNKSEEQ